MFGVCKAISRWWRCLTEKPLILTNEVKPKKKKKKKRKSNPYGGKWKGNI